MGTLKDIAAQCAQTFTLHYGDGSEEKILIRTRTHPELMAAQDAVAEARQEMSKKFGRGAAQYDWLVSDIEANTDATLASLVSAGEMMKYMKLARRKIAMPLPIDESKFPDEDKLEAEREAHTKRMEAYEQELNTETARLMEDREVELLAVPHEDLVAMAVKPLMARRLDAECEELLRCYWLWDSIRDAETKERYFESIDEIRSLPDQVKEYLASAVEEVDSVRPFEIKNSQGGSVTPNGPAANIPDLTKASSTSGSRGSSSRKRNTPGGRKR